MVLNPVQVIVRFSKWVGEKFFVRESVLVTLAEVEQRESLKTDSCRKSNSW